MTKIFPCIWYTAQAEEAAQFYAAILPNSRINRITALPVDSPSGSAESVKVVEFTLMEQPFMAFSGGKMDDFNHSISFVISCDTQEEIDRYWNALIEGGKPEQCGWLRDKYGLLWQIAPVKMQEWMGDPDRAKAARACQTMMEMVKLDIAKLQAAFDGK